MQGLTIALLMREQLSQVRADSLASKQDRAALELRRIEKDVRARSSNQSQRVSEPPSAPDAGWLPRMISSPFNR
jgi:hypothetical protein